MSSPHPASARNSGSGQHRARRRPRLRLALTCAAAMAVLGGGTAFACMGGGPHPVAAGHRGPVPVVGRSTAPAPTGTPTVGPNGGVSARPTVPARRTPPATRTARPAPRPGSTTPRPVTSTAPAGGTGGGTGSGTTSGDAVHQVLALINRSRAAQGLPAYTLTSGLDDSAAAHNRVMAGGCGLSHQCPGEAAFGDREIAAGVHWTSAGENIGEGGGVGASDSAIAASAVGLTQMMLNEKAPDDGHRRNILSSGYTRVGIAILRDSSGTVWLTQDFAN